MFHTRPPTYPYNGVFLQHPYSPQPTSHFPLTNRNLPSSHPHTLPVHILPKFSQGTTSPSHQMLPLSPQSSHISTNSTTQQYQTSFENAMNEIDAEL